MYEPSEIPIAEASWIAASKRSELDGKWVWSKIGSVEVTGGLGWNGWWPANTKLSPDQWWIHVIE